MRLLNRSCFLLFRFDKREGGIGGGDWCGSFGVCFSSDSVEEETETTVHVDEEVGIAARLSGWCGRRA